MRDTFLLPTRPRSDGRSTCRGVEEGARGVWWSRSRLWYGPKLLTKNTRPLSAEEAAAQSAATVSAALDRWQAVETSPRGALEPSKKSAEASAQGATGICRGPRQPAEERRRLTTSQVHSFTMRENFLVLGVDGWSSRASARGSGKPSPQRKDRCSPSGRTKAATSFRPRKESYGPRRVLVGFSFPFERKDTCKPSKCRKGAPCAGRPIDCRRLFHVTHARP